MDATALRRRRRAYARRARLGFEGYCVGSAAHLLQAMLQAGPRQAAARGLLAGAALALGGTLVAMGSAAAPAVGVAALLWISGGVLRFWLEVRRVRHDLGPPGWPDEAGVREPRVPPPDSGGLRAFRQLPPAAPEA